ncbi:MAG: acyltransferase [Nitrosopumilus sp.]|nr:acyltransferase [Nitrosopumilus sp.]NRA04642.1 acyltransferase [Nitrosopumilus sp.]
MEVDFVKKGLGTKIHSTCTFEELKKKQGSISFGDYCNIFEKCRFYVSEGFEIGDYGTIHNNSLIQAYKKCTIGHNAWIGQNSIINATDELKIGNNFAIGTDSKIWTHAYRGELLLGCKIAIGIPDYKSKSGAISIGDDFWGMGQITIGPGVKIGNKVIALTNSLITNDIPDNTIVGGTPAKPISIEGDLRGYVDLNEKERFDLMVKFSNDFSIINKNKIKIDEKNKRIILGDNEIIINIIGKETDEDATSYFDILKRSYTKKHNSLERKFMNFVLGYRARFIPE